MRYHALWEDTNKTLKSSVFWVLPGWVCLLFAVGLEEEKYREDATEFAIPQSICVRKIITEFTPPKFDAMGPCDVVYDVSQTGSYVELHNEFVQHNGCTWALTACDNFRIIGVPGVYQLELNDATAIGNVQVYAEFMKLHNISASVRDLFFD